MAMATYNPSTWEAKAGGSWVQGYPGLHNETLSKQSHTHTPKGRKEILYNFPKGTQPAKDRNCLYYPSGTNSTALITPLFISREEGDKLNY
jgi:hypothetical protein